MGVGFHQRFQGRHFFAVSFREGTLRETNVAFENGWLEDTILDAFRMAQPGSYFCSNNFQVLSVTNFCCLPGWQTLGPFRFSARVLREAFLDLLGQSMVFSPIPKFDRFVWRHLGPSVLGKSAWEVGSQSISMKRSLNDRIFSAPNGGGLRKVYFQPQKIDL